MLAHFPTPYHDELLYSVIARYSQRVSYPRNRAIVEELFGRGTIIAVVDFPASLQSLINRLIPGHDFTVDYLIDHHTLLPFYATFLPPERVRQLRLDMAGDNGSVIQFRAGLMASRIKGLSHLRYCPACALADREEYGEAHWHRRHHLVGVMFCPDHQLLLLNSPVAISERSTRYEFIAAETVIPRGEDKFSPAPSDLHPVLAELANDAAWMLGQPASGSNPKDLQQRYLSLLQKRGLATYTDQVRDALLLQEFQTYYPSDLLHQLQCDLNPDSGDNWLVRLVRRPDKTQHPLHHLLLIHFLGRTAATFFAEQPTWDYFGQAPWPCLNPVCSHYRQDVIPKCMIRYSYESHRPIGTFVCECGFSYDRAGPDQSPSDRLCYSNIISFGSVWETHLKQLWTDPEVSLRQAAQRLGVDPHTVKRQAARLGLTEGGRKRPGPITIKFSGKLPSNHERYYLQWEKLRRENPEAGIKQLRQLLPSVYTWLYRNDPDWLRKQLPAIMPRPDAQPRIDWTARDTEVAQAMRTAAEQLRQSEQPVWLTTTAIARTAGHLALIHQHLDKLPQTRATLEDLLESRIDFAVRRVRWALEQYHREDIVPKRWQLIRRAGVERLKEEPLVAQALEDAL